MWILEASQANDGKSLEPVKVLTHELNFATQICAHFTA